MNTTHISTVLATGALALGLCATAAAQSSADATTSQSATGKVPVTQQVKSTVTRFTDTPARASKVIGTEVVYATGEELCTVKNLVVSSTGQVAAILERPDALMSAVPLGSLEPRLKGMGEGRMLGEQKSTGKTPHVEHFTLRCEREVCDSAPTVKSTKLIDGAWLARSTAHFAPAVTPAAEGDEPSSAGPNRTSSVAADARAPILLKSLMGLTLENAQGDQLGEIEDVALDLGTGMVSYVIVSTGGVLGVGASLHAIGFDTLTLDRSADSASIVMSKNSFSELPELDIDRLAADPLGAVAMVAEGDLKVADRN